MVYARTGHGGVDVSPYRESAAREALSKCEAPWGCTKRATRHCTSHCDADIDIRLCAECEGHFVWEQGPDVTSTPLDAVSEGDHHG